MASFSENPIAYAGDIYRTAIPSPLLSAFLLGMGAWGLSHVAYDPMVDTLEGLGYPL